MAFVYFDWEEVNINWDALDLNWEEVGYLVRDLLPLVGGGIPVPGQYPKPKYDIKEVNKLSKEKRRAIIRIACKIEGTKFEEYKYGKDDDVEITVDHVDIILSKIINNIKVDVQNIS